MHVYIGNVQLAVGVAHSTLGRSGGMPPPPGKFLISNHESAFEAIRDHHLGSRQAVHRMVALWRCGT